MKRWAPTPGSSLATLVLLLFALPTGAEPLGSMVIPSGQDQLLGSMLGANGVIFPGQCRLEGAQAVQSRIEARFACEDEPGLVSIVLFHPSDHPDASFRTEQFAIVTTGRQPPPDGFLMALADRIRREETEWRWLPRALIESDDDCEIPVPSTGFQIDATSPQTARLLAEARDLHRRLDPRSALATLLEAARQNPGQPAINALVMVSIAAIRPDDATLEELERAASGALDDPLAQLQAGTAAFYNGYFFGESRAEKMERYAVAEVYLARCLPAFGACPRTLAALALCHFRLGHQRRAERLIAAAMELDPGDPELLFNRAEIFHRNDLEQARSDMERYLDAAPSLRTIKDMNATTRIRHAKAIVVHLQGGYGGLDTTNIFDLLVSSERVRTVHPLWSSEALGRASAVVFILLCAFVFVLRFRIGPSGSK